MPDFGRWTGNGGDPSLNEINRTDRFLDALADEQPVYATDPGEAELAQLLAGWRDEVRRAPLRRALTPRDAVIAFEQARAARRRTRASLAVIGSTAAAVLCLGGFGAMVAGAGPGDALYGLRTAIFGERANATRDDAVVLAAQTQLAEVQQLISEGRWDDAQQKLQTLTTTVATVTDAERKQELVSQWQELTVKVEAQDPAATLPPGAPPPEFPELPAVVFDTTRVETTEPPREDPGQSGTPGTRPSAEPRPTEPVPTEPLPTEPLPSSAFPLPTGPLPTRTFLPTPTGPLPTSVPAPTAQLPAPTPTAVPTPTGPLPTSTMPRPTPTEAPEPTVTVPRPTVTSAPPPTLVPPVSKVPLPMPQPTPPPAPNTTIKVDPEIELPIQTRIPVPPTIITQGPTTTVAPEMPR